MASQLPARSTLTYRQMERSTIPVMAKRGRSIRQIATAVGRSPTTISRVRTEPIDKPPARRRRRSKGDPYRAQIEQGVEQGLTAVRMLELARADPVSPDRGGDAVFRATVRRVRRERDQTRAAHAAPGRFEGLPAEHLQVDWGAVRHFPFTLAPPGTRSFLACRLTYSRWVWVRFTTDRRQATLFRGLGDCCIALGFVPWVLVFDTMKTGTSPSGRRRCGNWRPSSTSIPRPAPPGRVSSKGRSNGSSTGRRRPSSSAAPSPTRRTWPPNWPTGCPRPTPGPRRRRARRR